MLPAARSRIWRALSSAEEFGQWLCVDFTGKEFARRALETISGQWDQALPRLKAVVEE